MKKNNQSSSIPSCGCNDRCNSPTQLRCRCHDLNALLALALVDYGRSLRRRHNR
jgi:hypothetical protein